MWERKRGRSQTDNNARERMREEIDRKMKRTPRELIQTFMINHRNRHQADRPDPALWSPVR